MKFPRLQVLAVIFAVCFIGTGSAGCTVDLDCGNGPKCLDGVCTCDEGFIWVSEMHCLPVAKEVGEGCDDDVQCKDLGDLVKCQDKTCFCTPQAYLAENKSCEAKRNLGQECKKPTDCYVGPNTEANVSCTDGKCACPETYMPNTDNTECTRKEQELGASCMVKEECIVAEGSSAKPECKDKICSCPSDHEASEDNTKCNSGVKNTLSILSIVVFTALAKIIS